MHLGYLSRMVEVLAGAGALLLIAVVLWSYISDKPTKAVVWLLGQIVGCFVGIFRVAVGKSFRHVPPVSNNFDRL